MTTRTEEAPDLLHNAGLAIVFAVVTVLVAIDLATDFGAGTTPLHLLLEATVIAIGVGATAWLTRRVRRLARDARDLRVQARELEANLARTQADAERWRRDASDLIRGLGAAIDDQLARWGLSPAEREIALLLLKGLSHKEIAQLREVAETTVRQQARALYRKAGLAGRNDLAAFFLEDLLGPR